MSNFLNASDIKDQVSLVNLLTNLGYQPSHKTGKELLYLSMLRDSDTNPSFSVNDQLGVWYDHGMGKGGNIIDFGMAYWPVLSLGEVLKKIVEISGSAIPVPQGDALKLRKRRHVQKVPHYRVLEVKDLGHNDAITRYLQSRGVWDAALGRLKEVYYYVEDEKKHRKYFFAAGWQNECGGWEVRNQYFKGCLGLKGLTLIPGDDTRLAVFEGYLNYLSWLTINSGPTETILVLNSLALLQAGIKKAEQYQQSDLYLDNDDKGKAAALTYLEAIPGSNNRSAIYEGYNDFNDWLTGRPESVLPIDESLVPPGNNNLPGIKR